MKILRRKSIATGLFITMLITACRPAPTPTSAALEITSLDDAIDQAQQINQPVAVLVIDSDRSEADRTAKTAFESAMQSNAKVVPVVLDLETSRNRAAAAPLHALDHPTFVCISPHGVILSRDEQPTADVMRQRIDAAVTAAPQVDREFLQLQSSANENPADVDRQMALSDFLLAHHNDKEAIAHLKRVADDESADIAVRVRAWVAMGKAHLWVVEPEKARHAAEGLIDTLGPTSPLAIAGGNLVRGLQDTKARRYDRARDEFAAAIAAAPDSPYGQEAAESLKGLPAAP